MVTDRNNDNSTYTYRIVIKMIVFKLMTLA